QFGEGLREVRIVELLRRSGDSVRRGDALYVIETDKTTIEMESSHDGRLLGWRVAPGDVVTIGAAVAVIGEDQEERRAVTVPEVEPRLVPPRTRAYAKSKGLTDDALDAIPSETEKLLPSDIDAFLASPLSGTTLAGNYREHRVTGTARTLIYRLRRSLSTVVPGTVAIDVPSSLFVRQGQSAGSIRPTSFQVFGHAVAIIAQGHAKFRSIMVRDDVIREYDQVNIGIALARSNDELITAVIRGAGQMALEEFVSACMRQMRAALREGDQASDDTQILLT